MSLNSTGYNTLFIRASCINILRDIVVINKGPSECGIEEEEGKRDLHLFIKRGIQNIMAGVNLILYLIIIRIALFSDELYGFQSGREPSDNTIVLIFLRYIL